MRKLDTRTIRSLRPSKRPVDAWRPLGVEIELERSPSGRLENSVTLFLAGAECPFSCVFCDLWRFTLDGPTPPGAVPEQIDLGLAEVLRRGAAPDVVKLYNASNFFDPRAVPPQDYQEIAVRLGGAQRVVVECHPRRIDHRAVEFSRLLAGRLEVAIGLETSNPAALESLNKEMTLADLERAVDLLRRHDIDWRAFVLVGLPYQSGERSVTDAIESAGRALQLGARSVSLIPLRSGNGAVDQLVEQRAAPVVSLDDLEAALDGCLSLEGVVQADLWDADRLPACSVCRKARIDRLARINRSGETEPSAACGDCSRGTDAHSAGRPEAVPLENGSIEQPQ